MRSGGEKLWSMEFAKFGRGSRKLEFPALYTGAAQALPNLCTNTGADICKTLYTEAAQAPQAPQAAQALPKLCTNTGAGICKTLYRSSTSIAKTLYKHRSRHCQNIVQTTNTAANTAKHRRKHCQIFYKHMWQELPKRCTNTGAGIAKTIHNIREWMCEGSSHIAIPCWKYVTDH